MFLTNFIITLLAIEPCVGYVHLVLSFEIFILFTNYQTRIFKFDIFLCWKVFLCNMFILKDLLMAIDIFLRMKIGVTLISL